MHLDELDQLDPVLVRHPIAGLDLSAALHVLEERLLAAHLRLLGSVVEHQTVSSRPNDR
jgi:hypothetical protein